MVVNLQVYTTQADQQPAIRLMQEVVNNGSIITVCTLQCTSTMQYMSTLPMKLNISLLQKLRTRDHSSRSDPHHRHAVILVHLLRCEAV